MVLYSFWLSNAMYYKKNGRDQESQRMYQRFMDQARALAVGDKLQFGRYALPNGVKPREVFVEAPLTWLVLRKEGSRMLLLSEPCVDWDFFDGSGPLIGPSPETNWAKSDVRNMLNGDFLEASFNAVEKSAILLSDVSTDRNYRYQTQGCELTKDRLFLLSVEEALEAFAADGEASVARYRQEGKIPEDVDTGLSRAEMHFAEVPYGDGPNVRLSVEPQQWWLRSPGKDKTQVACVDFVGWICPDGLDCGSDEVGIRPAMWIDLELLNLA